MRVRYLHAKPAVEASAFQQKATNVERALGILRGIAGNPVDVAVIAFAVIGVMAVASMFMR